MRRSVFSLVLGVVVAGLFLSGLVWMTSLRERQWSKDRETFDRQVTFVATILAIVLGASVLNHNFNRRRSNPVTSTASNLYSPRAEIPDHPLRGRLLDG
jgi:hypothetical protein